MIGIVIIMMKKMMQIGYDLNDDNDENAPAVTDP